MKFGSLASLPITTSDFASACLTASVPRTHLKLILIRVVQCDASGRLDSSLCTTTAILFDDRHKMNVLRNAIINCVCSTRRAASQIYVYTRISGSVVLVTFDDHSSVYVSPGVSNDKLRGSVHVGSALKAYQSHCKQRSRVCMSSVVKAYQEYTKNPPENRDRRDRRYLSMYVEGFKRLGVDNPTERLPEICECTGTQGCCCFMNRAVWRCGKQWMILYAILPPRVYTKAVGLLRVHPNEEPEWAKKIVDSTSSESEDVENPLDSICPKNWCYSCGHHTQNTEQLFFNSRHCSALVFEDDSTASESETSISSSSTGSMYAGGNLIQNSVLWALSNAKNFVPFVTSVCKNIGLYYRVVLQYVVAKSQRKTFYRCSLRRASEIAQNFSDSRLFDCLKCAQDGNEALKVLVNVIETHSVRVGGRMDERLGYTLVVILAFIYACTHSERQIPTRSVNTWDMYTDYM